MSRDKAGGQTEAKRELSHLAAMAADQIDLAEAGLALAALEHPQRERTAYRALLADIIASAGHAAAAATDGALENAEARVELLSTVLIGRYRLIGDERDEDEGASGNLMQLLDRRRGPALTIGLLWLHVGRHLGWEVEALAFPGPFLLRIGGAGGQRAIIDPFQGCRLDAAGLRDLLKATAGAAAELAPALYAAMDNRAVLLRLQTSIKLRCLRHGQLRRALDAVEAALLFAPDQAGLWREAGMMHLRQGSLSAAVAALDQFIARAPNSPLRHRTSVLVQDLRRRLT
jgi:regulator of sirC expression with transglutaminase-like and TPR domain